MSTISWKTILYVGSGGIIGALSRYAVTLAANGLPGDEVAGTFIANISGALLLGLFATITAGRADIGPDLRRGVMIGLLGSYTTLSALSYQTVTLAEDGHLLWAVLYSTGSLLLGLAAVACGTQLAKR